MRTERVTEPSPAGRVAVVIPFDEVRRMVTLQTERLTLRMLCESDLDAYAEMCAGPEVMRYIGDGQPVDRARARIDRAEWEAPQPDRV